MKLLLCTKCEDIIRLQKELRECKCKSVSGQYVDGMYAIYHGESAVPLGISYKSIEHAIGSCPTDAPHGEEFIAFVIPKINKTFHKVPKVCLNV